MCGDEVNLNGETCPAPTNEVGGSYARLRMDLYRIDVNNSPFFNSTVSAIASS